MQLLVRVTPKPGVSSPKLIGFYNLLTGAMSLRPIEEIALPVPPLRAVGARTWGDAEISIVRDVYPAGGIAALMERLPERSKKSLLMQVWRLGLKRTAEVPSEPAGQPLVISPPASIVEPFTPVQPSPAPNRVGNLAQPSWQKAHQQRVAAARRFLEGLGHAVQAHSSIASAGWRVSGVPGGQTSDDLIRLAMRKGMK